MASTAFMTSCCLGNESFIIDGDLPGNTSSLEIKVISIITIVIAAASAFGIFIILCPFGSRHRSLKLPRRKGNNRIHGSLDHVTKCIVVAGILADIGLVVRSALWLADQYPPSDDTNFTDYKHLSCIATSVWIQYFFLCVVFWHVVYAMESYLTSQAKCSSHFAKHFIGWMLPAALTSVQAFLAYHPDIGRCSARYLLTREGLFALYLCPVVLAFIIMVVLFVKALTHVRRSLIGHYGRFTTLERETLDNVKIKFIIVTSTFAICWLPNILTGIFINTLDDKTGDIILVCIVLECVFNPFQVLIDSMVMFGWPPTGCCGLFRTHRSSSRDGINVGGDRGAQRGQQERLLASSDSETDPLISFSRTNRQ